MKKKIDLSFGKYAKGFNASPRTCDMCHELYIPDGWEKRETTMPEFFPRIAFDSLRCRERSFEVCGECTSKIILFIEKDYLDYEKLKKLREELRK